MSAPFEVRPGEYFGDAVTRGLYTEYARLMGDPDPESFQASVERRRRVEAADPTAQHRFIGDDDVCDSCGQVYPAVDQIPGSRQCHSCAHDEMIESPADEDGA